MELTLEVRTGDAAGRRFVVGPGPGVRVGRQPGTDLRLAADANVSNVHCRVEHAAGGGVVTDLGSRFGTFINGRRVTACLVVEGDEIRVGDTILVVRTGTGPLLPAITPPPAPITPPPAAEPDLPPAILAAVAAHLASQTDPLYGVFAPDRAAGLAELLATAGVTPERLTANGPWLVPVGPGVVAGLVAAGWGRRWGVYLTCNQPADAVAAYLRSRLTVKSPDGRHLDFLFYDPKVLRTYFPTATAAEVAAFVGPVGRWVVESVEPGQVLEFAAAYRDWRRLTPGI